LKRLAVDKPCRSNTASWNLATLTSGGDFMIRDTEEFGEATVRQDVGKHDPSKWVGSSLRG